MKCAKPALIHMRFLDALQGPGSKMSASDNTSAIFMSDTPKQIQSKINKYAFSGGQETVELHREKGGNPDVDVPYKYLEFFLEDDVKLKQIYDDYKSGKLLTSEIKAICIEQVQQYVAGFQERRAKVDEDIVKNFMSVRPLEWKGNPKVPRADLVVPVTTASSGDVAAAGDGQLSKNALKKIAKDKAIADKKAEKQREQEAKAAAAAQAQN